MSLTIIIVAITVAISFLAWNNPSIYQQMMLNPYAVSQRKQYWRFLTSGFIHGGYMHLGFNMFTLYFFGTVVEVLFSQILGGDSTTTFVLFYVSAIIISDIPSFLKHRNQPGYNSLGASGAVSAMVFCSILYMPLNKICLFAVLCLPGFILGGLYIVYSYTQGKNMSDNINHDAHLFGAIYGIIFGLAVYPESGPEFFRQIMSYRLF
ncbi:MAG: rhomboid family intramembrane serine protease [Cyclobacteriaceae bacterium]